MKKKRKIDYIIRQNDDERLIFRFYPRQSSCHSFGDEPPKDWSDVYKVYYSYAIIKQWRCYSEDQWKSEVMFYENCDECSVIDEISYICSLLADGLEVFKRDDGKEIDLLNRPIFPIGMGVEWTITKKSWTSYSDENVKYTHYKFTLFDYGDKGFRFRIDEKDIKAFGEYLNDCCEYMLEHGDPI